MNNPPKGKATSVDFKIRVSFLGAELVTPEECEPCGQAGRSAGQSALARSVPFPPYGGSGAVICNHDGTFTLRVSGLTGQGVFWGKSFVSVGAPTAPAGGPFDNHPGWTIEWDTEKFGAAFGTVFSKPFPAVQPTESVTLVIWVAEASAAQVSAPVQPCPSSSSSSSSGSPSSSGSSRAALGDGAPVAFTQNVIPKRTKDRS